MENRQSIMKRGLRSRVIRSHDSEKRDGYLGPWPNMTSFKQRPHTVGGFTLRLCHGLTYSSYDANGFLVSQRVMEKTSTVNETKLGGRRSRRAVRHMKGVSKRWTSETARGRMLANDFMPCPSHV